ncbi:hypothetical protein DFH29DRAFT_933860 [Suillus ampliporus]|nr:hypothetical protein DFH29DRAFT_933860 [Suillus ampliporus]
MLARSRVIHALDAALADSTFANYHITLCPWVTTSVFHPSHAFLPARTAAVPLLHPMSIAYKPPSNYPLLLSSYITFRPRFSKMLCGSYSQSDGHDIGCAELVAVGSHHTPFCPLRLAESLVSHVHPLSQVVVLLSTLLRTVSILVSVPAFSLLIEHDFLTFVVTPHWLMFICIEFFKST